MVLSIRVPTRLALESTNRQPKLVTMPIIFWARAWQQNNQKSMMSPGATAINIFDSDSYASYVAIRRWRKMKV